MINQGFRRYIPILEEKGIVDTSGLMQAYLSCTLGSVKGLGRKFFSLLREFFNNQKKYSQLYSEMKGGAQA